MNGKKLVKENKGLFCFNEDVQGSVLYLCKPEDTWDYWTTLMHEIHHIVHFQAKKKMMQDARGTSLFI